MENPSLDVQLHLDKQELNRRFRDDEISVDQYLREKSVLESAFNYEKLMSRQ